MLLFDLREPINALSHGAAMILALPITWALWSRSVKSHAGGSREPWSACSRHQRGKDVCLLIFGISLIMCYGTSAAFHAVRLSGEPLYRLQRLDHVGIYLLISGTYTPVAWALMRGSWSWGTLTTVWTTALLCATRVWYGGVLPIWVSTLVYLAMGWGALFCYFKLAESYSHRTLLPLPLGGVFYSAGALVNLLRWPVLVPGVFGAHELLHFFVIGGSACHIFFMIKVVVPAPAPTPVAVPVGLPRPSLGSRWEPAREQRRRWLPHFPTHRRRVNALLAAGTRPGGGDNRDSASTSNDVGPSDRPF
jgi:hemolysin III